MANLALITGATAGIGRATAMNMARLGYDIHILGSNKKRGKETLQCLKEINSAGKHCFFPVDLSQLETVNNFLDEYLRHYEALDVLVLNAGIFPRQKTRSQDGIDLSFSVGYISRYLFSIRLNPLLANQGMILR